jgi:hypothetical protein
MNCNDGTEKPPRLRLDAAWMMVKDFPPYHSGPRGDDASILAAVKAAGYEGVQGGDPKLVRAAGLRYTAMGRVNVPGEAQALAMQAKKDGADCLTLHAGWGDEGMAEAIELLKEIVAVSHKLRLPIFVETHRATLLQDQWRSVELVCNVDGLRINGDFSHYYTGQEMRYGDFNARLDNLEVLLNRVGFMHGRIGNSCCMQVEIAENDPSEHMAHFRAMWTRVFQCFRDKAQQGDYFIFCPELLSNEFNYARMFRTASGELREECDRWTQAKILCDIARECWDASIRRRSFGGA